MPKAKHPRFLYPESDGKPIADNTVQFEWIATIKGNLDAQYRDDANVFVAGDLFWYPVEGHPEIVQAPDTLVVFGRPKGHRGSYRQWEEGNIPPQVVFEILSPNNTVAEMQKKFAECEHAKAGRAREQAERERQNAADLALSAQAAAEKLRTQLRSLGIEPKE